LKKVLYTSLVGDYDVLRDPEVVDEGWDYICFSNHLNQQDFDVWQIRSVPLKGSANAEKSRYPKLCPHELLSEYEISIYIDSNILIKTDFLYQRSLELEADSNALISIPVHPTRNCVYKEAEMLKYRGKDNVKAIDRHIAHLGEEGFPDDYGLFENNVIWRRHLDDAIQQVSSNWWDEYMNYSKRDQLSLVYCLWKAHVNCIPLMPPEIQDHRKSEHFEFTKHKQNFLFPIKRWKTKFNYLLKNRKKPY